MLRRGLSGVASTIPAAPRARCPIRRPTMHMLHLLRHAKSSWKEGVEDRERSLNRRGREAAGRVGRHLTAAVGALDLVLCSNAKRTRETLRVVLAEFATRPDSM